MMERLERTALLFELAKQLHEKGSWCGETHLQKAAYWAEELRSLPLGFQFILYKHGPFSFDLRDELTSMRADGLLELSPNTQPYGPTLRPSDRGDILLKRYRDILAQFADTITRAANELANKNVSELERLTTALYVTKREMPQDTAEKRAERIRQIKPHIPFDKALQAIDAVDRVISDR
ncbi:MAG: hypothetical protein HY313_00330 [Acidobacteria bacterium]|nr:hypothetical protein [Acidobacteriota bacterium]